MKKIFIAIFVLISVQSFAQFKRKYAEKTNTDVTIDSFYVKIPVSRDSVFKYSDDSFIEFTLEYYLRNNLPIPAVFANFVMCADGVYRNIPSYTASGSYTPTLFNTTNIAASTAYECGWLRVGNRVTVFGLVDIDATSAVATVLGMSLPIASNLTASNDVAGTGSSNAAAGLVLGVAGSAANDRALFLFVATSLTNNTYSFTFSYTIK